jgi:hypothetical protein
MKLVFMILLTIMSVLAQQGVELDNLRVTSSLEIGEKGTAQDYTTFFTEKINAANELTTAGLEDGAVSWDKLNSNVYFQMMANQKTVNVLDYLADDTGQTNTASAFQAAANALEEGFIFYVPNGLYKINSNVYFPGYDNITYVFEGKIRSTVSSELIFQNYDGDGENPDGYYYYTGFDASCLVPQNYPEFNKGLNYIVIADSNEWKQLPQWREDGSMRIGFASSRTGETSSGQYIMNQSFDFAGFGEKGGYQLMYSTSQFPDTMSVKSNADLDYDFGGSGEYFIVAMPLVKGTTIKGLSLINARATFRQHSFVNISDVSFTVENEYRETVRSGLVLAICSNVNISNIIAHNFAYSGYGYGVALESCENVNIVGLLGGNCRHVVTTGTAAQYRMSTRNIMISDFVLNYDNYFGIDGGYMLDTHGHTYNVTYKDGVMLNNSNVKIGGIHFRGVDSRVFNVTKYGNGEFVYVNSGEGLYNRGDLTVNGCDIIKGTGQLVRVDGFPGQTVAEDSLFLRNVTIKDNRYYSDSENNNTGSQGRFLRIDGAMVDTVMIVDNEYYSEPGGIIRSTDALVGLLNYNDHSHTFIKHLEMSGNKATGFRDVLFSKMYGPIKNILIDNNVFKEFESILYLISVDKSGANYTELDTIRVNNILLKDNQFENMSHLHRIDRMWVDEFESIGNKYIGSNYGVRYYSSIFTPQKFTTMTFEDDLFQSVGFADTDPPEILNSQVTDLISFQGVEFSQLPVDKWNDMSARRAKYSNQLTQWVGPYVPSVGFGDRDYNADFRPDVVFDGVRLIGDVASGDKIINMNDSLYLTIRNSFFDLGSINESQPIYVKYPNPFKFINNYVEVDEMTSANLVYIASPYVAGADNIYYFGNTLVNYGGITGRPLDVQNINGLTWFVGDNKATGWTLPNRYYQSSGNINPVWHNEFYLMGEDNVIYRINVNGGTITATINY